MTPEDAKEFGVEDKQIVSVEVKTNGRSLTFGDVVCRVSASYQLQCILIQMNQMQQVDQKLVKSLNN